MKPYIHAQSSVEKFGGKTRDYIEIHDWFDQTKSHFGDNRHRAILHNSFGIFLAEQFFGHVITNSDNKEVSVRDIGEQHVVEDLGFIPNVSDYLSQLTHQDWMSGKGKKLPESQALLENIQKIFETERGVPIFYDGSGLNGIDKGSGFTVDGSRPVRPTAHISD